MRIGFPKSRISPLGFFVFLCALPLVAVSSGFAQAAKRCNLTVNTTPGAAADTACLDLVALTQGGAAIQTGNNVTRISSTGLKLCKNAFVVTSGGAADVVFIVDNSGSMWSNSAFIQGTDTTFYDQEGQCASAVETDTLNYSVQDDRSIRLPPLVTIRNIKILSSNPSGCKFAGDPYNSRAVVVKNAIDYMAANAPLSTAGVVGFARDTMNAQPPLQLNNPANVAQVKSKMLLDSIGDTQYNPPLDRAKAWLADTTYVKNSQQAIVFISDGKPNNNSDGKALVNAGGMPPIYSIYLGKTTTSDTASLKWLSDQTGGTFYHVDPTKAGGIQAVMTTIIQKITATTLPRSVEITNVTLGQTSVATKKSISADGNLNLALDSIIALKQGLNNFTVNVVQGDGKPNIYAFKVQADGPAATQSSSTLQCFDPPTLTMLNPQGQPETQYSLTAASYNIRLTRDSSDMGPVTIGAMTQDALRTVGWGDQEAIPLAAVLPAGAISVFQSPYPFNGLKDAPIAGNGTLEANAGGLITLTWTYSRDPRETVTYTLPGAIKPVTLPPTATPPGKTFTNLDPVFTVELAPGEAGATVHYTLDGTVPDANSPVYTGPIAITKTTTLKAMDTKLNQLPSPVVQFLYTQTLAPNPPSIVTVQFANGLNFPGHSLIPAPLPPPGITFIPIDQSGVALPGGVDGKCGPNCDPGGGAPGIPFVGPIINLEIPGPVEYEFSICSNLGEFVVSGKGKVKIADLPLLALTQGGAKRLARIVWTGRTGTGGRAANGAYILRCTVRTLNENPTLVVPITLQSNLIRFGLVR